MCKWYMYTHILTWFCWFSWNVVLLVLKPALSMKSTWKAKKKTQLIQNTFLISLILIWCFIEYRGKANQIYLIFWWYLVVYVVHVCLNGTCIHIYWPGFVGFHEKWCFYMKTGTFCEKHWKLKSTPEKWKVHEKHMKSEKHHFSWKAYAFHYVMSFSIMKSTVKSMITNFITDFTGMEFSVKSIMKSCWF